MFYNLAVDFWSFYSSFPGDLNMQTARQNDYINLLKKYISVLALCGKALLMGLVTEVASVRSC